MSNIRLCKTFYATAVLVLAVVVPGTAQAELELLTGNWVVEVPVAESNERVAYGSGMATADADLGLLWTFQYAPPSQTLQGPKGDVDEMVAAMFPVSGRVEPSDMQVAGQAGRVVEGTAKGLRLRICYAWVPDGFVLLSVSSLKLSDEADALHARTCGAIKPAVDWDRTLKSKFGVVFSPGSTVWWEGGESPHSESFLVPELALTAIVVRIEASRAQMPSDADAQRTQFVAPGATRVDRLELSWGQGWLSSGPTAETPGMWEASAGLAGTDAMWLILFGDIAPGQQDAAYDWLAAALAAASLKK